MNVVFDIEADGLKPTKIHCLVFYQVDDGEVIKFRPNELQQAKEYFSKVNKLIGHNIINYDIPAVEKLMGIDLSGKKVVDTLVLSRLFNPTREGGHGLESWGYRLGYNKGEYGEQENAWDNFSEEMLEYCERDVLLNYKVYNALRIESKGFAASSVVLEHKVYPIIEQQRKNGFLLDVEKAQGLVAHFNDELMSITNEVQKVFKDKVEEETLYAVEKKSGGLSKTGKNIDGINRRLTKDEFNIISAKGSVVRKTVTPFNLGSRKQIGEYLIEFGWKPVKHTPTGQPIVDEAVLSKVKGIPEAQLIATYLMLQKRLAQVSKWLTYVEDDDRVRGYVNANGTVTGRMTHSHPNMAQIPATGSPFGKECRSCWTVAPTHRLVGIDASGLELRVLAHYMNDKEYTNEILNGDIHTANQKLAGLESRNQAKTFIYALLYGAGDAKLGSVAGGGAAVGSRLRKSFFANLPAFKSLANSVRREAKANKVKSLDGRMLNVRSAHAALNTKLQGGGAVIMKQALVNFSPALDKAGIFYYFVANVHDEWQIECKEEEAHTVGKLGVKAIQDVTEQLNLNCPLDGEYNIGMNWAETH